jgi:hypothetical protein
MLDSVRGGADSTVAAAHGRLDGERAWPHRLMRTVATERDYRRMTWVPSPVHGSCAGSLIVHVVDRTAAGCTLDDEPDGCAGIELRHEGDPTDCVAEWGG